jgi:hypothetical protein
MRSSVRKESAQFTSAETVVRRLGVSVISDHTVVSTLSLLLRSPVSQRLTKRAIYVELAFFFAEDFLLLHLNLHYFTEHLSVESIFALADSQSISTCI